MMNRKKARNLRDTLLITGVVMMLGSCLCEPLFICGLIVLLSCMIPDFLFNKCPHCGRHLGKNAGNYCQHCGEKLEE